MHGPVVLYEDLMVRALAAFEVRGPGKLWQVRRNLREKGRCPMCEMGYGPDSSGMARPELVEKGRDLNHFRAFAAQTMSYWQKAVCGKCADDGASARCRRHLLEDASLGLLRELSAHRKMLEYVVQHLKKFERSFIWGYHGTETDEDRAALISSVGWCSGWRIFLQIVDGR